METKIIDDILFYKIKDDFYETDIDKNNIKIRIEYIRNKNNKIFKKITTKILVEKKYISKSILQRQKWKPFGKALLPNNDSITTKGKSFILDFSKKNDSTKLNVNHLQEKNYKNGNSQEKIENHVKKINNDFKNKIIRILNLPEETTYIDIRDLVIQFGKIRNIYLFIDYKKNNICKGLAFILCENTIMCNKIKQKLDKYNYGHNRLSVDIM